MAEAESRLFWTSVLRAAEAEPREATTIKGASGIQHPVIALGVDEGRRRLLIISGEHDARTSALAQVDIQAALENTEVVVARPIALDLSPLAKELVSILGRSVITQEDVQKLDPKSASYIGPIDQVIQERLAPVFKPLETLAGVPLRVLAQWMQAIQQLALVQFNVEQACPPTDNNRVQIDIARLAEVDPLELDNHFGICPVPLYQFSSDEVETLKSGGNLDDVREILLRRQIFQYFFPAPDHLALGLVDRGARSVAGLLDQLVLAPKIGHPYGNAEIIGGTNSLSDVIDSLQDRNLLVEGEVGLEVGPAGKTIRTTVRFKPREGFLSKVINRFSFQVNINPFEHQK